MDSMNITDEAIAVIGMSCRFPGAPDLDGYWRNLCEGKVSVTFLDRKDLAAAGVDHGLLRDPNSVPATSWMTDSSGWPWPTWPVTTRHWTPSRKKPCVWAPVASGFP